MKLSTPIGTLSKGCPGVHDGIPYQCSFYLNVAVEESFVSSNKIWMMVFALDVLLQVELLDFGNDFIHALELCQHISTEDQQMPSIPCHTYCINFVESNIHVLHYEPR